jgi:hypothetical protein
MEFVIFESPLEASHHFCGFLNRNSHSRESLFESREVLGIKRTSGRVIPDFLDGYHRFAP